MFKEKFNSCIACLKSNEAKAIYKDLFETISFVLIMLVILKFFFFELRWIPSSSMEPTLQIKDRIVVERMSRFVKTPQRGEIMVFYPPETILKKDFISLFSRYTGIGCKDIAYIKRVIGIPGDKIEIKKTFNSMDYQVFVNDKALTENYINFNLPYTDCKTAQYCGPFVVPENNYFMLGDNRGNSNDSRYWGFVPEKNFIGRAVFIFWPFTRLELFKTPLYTELK